MASNVDSKLPAPRAVVRALNGMIAAPPIIGALAPFAITPGAAANASEHDKAALAALVAVYTPDSRGTPETCAVTATRAIVGALISYALAPDPIDDTPEAAEAAQQTLFGAAMRAPYVYYAGPESGRSSPLRTIYTQSTGLPWWEVLDAQGHVVT